MTADPTAEVPATAPPLVAVLVAHDPGEWFEETLGSLRDQTYRNLAVLVVDASSEEELSPRIAEVLPEARVHRLDRNPGFGAAANVVRDLVDGAAFYAFIHDDVALEPDSLRALVEEAYRSNAGIIGPKLVDWDDPRRLLQVGLGADKTGAIAAMNERGELDQEQHDAIRDVFAIPGGCTVIRADLFDALEGFDPEIDGLGDDVDLCWRAHALGARVLVAPVTAVRHREARAERLEVDDRRRRQARARLRSSLVCYGWWHRLRVLPQALVFALVEAIAAVFSGHPCQAADVLGAWPWNLRRYGSIRARRRALKAKRTVADREVRDLQVRGSARLSAFVRARLHGRDERVSSVSRSSRDLAGAVRDGSRQLTVAFAVVLVVLVLLSSRDLILHGVPAIGQFSRFPDSPGTLLSAWWSGWRRAGLGSPGAQPTGDLVVGSLGYLLFGATGLLRTLLIIGTVPIGALGAWRLAKPIGSRRASVASLALYLAIPVPYNALASGSWGGLLVYAVAPWLLLALGRASGAAPFGPAGADPSEPAAQLPRRSPLQSVFGLALALALVSCLVPFILVIAIGVAVALTVGSILCFRVIGLGRMLLAAGGAIGLALALHLPWSLDLLTGRSPWESLAGVSSTVATPLTLGEILRFETGPWGAPPLGWALLLAGALPVIIGRSWRLEWAVRAWMVALGGWGALWASQQGHLPLHLPAPEVVLAPVAAALGFAAALGLASFETDLRAYHFGWRQVLSVLAALGVVLGAAPLAGGLLDGRWRTPHNDFVSALDQLVEPTDDGAFRVVWLGDPDHLPVRGWRYNDQLAIGTSDDGPPTIRERFVVPEAGATPLIADAFELGQDHRTNRLGRLLAPMGIRYVVVQNQLAPSGDVDAVDGTVPVLDMLAQQLDLARVPVTDGITIYRNLAWAPSRSVLPAREGDRTTWTDAVADDLSGASPALVLDDGAVDAKGTVAEAGDLLVASTADADWHARVDGVALRRTEAYGWANQFDATTTGSATLTYDTSLGHRAAAVGQVLLWLLAIVAWRRSRSAPGRKVGDPSEPSDPSESVASVEPVEAGVSEGEG